MINYIFEYVNENEFKKLERSLKKYNMLAYKKLYFEYYASLRKGEFLGKVISDEMGVKLYELKLPTDSLFSKVHGDLVLHYQTFEDNRNVLLVTIKPEEILSEGHKSELVTYKGVMISSQNSEKDIFKINLLNMLNKD